MINHTSRVWTCNMPCCNIITVVIRPMNYAKLPFGCLFLVCHRRNHTEITLTAEGEQAPGVDAPTPEGLKARLGGTLSNLFS